jgi:lipoprotein-anchoring transpeptidase ErfK/SrfK
MFRPLRTSLYPADKAKTRQRQGLGQLRRAHSVPAAFGFGLLAALWAVPTQHSMASAATKPPAPASKSVTTLPGKNSANKLAKTTAKSVAPASGNTKTSAAPKAVALKSLSARVAVSGWEGIGSSSWPDVGDSVIARANGDWVDVFRNPADPNTSLRLIKGRSVAGPVVLMALGAAGDFVRVAIPLRPNGTLGWVKSADVTLIKSAFRVEIDLSTNAMTVFDGLKTLFRAPVAAGTGGTPTPRGLFFLKEVVPQAPGGALGPYAFGLSGFSDVLNSFGGGEGVIGIHGTNAPGKLGTNVSHGCVRVDNVTITKMVRLLPLGTPVEIVESAKGAKPTRLSSSWLETLLDSASGSVEVDAAVAVVSATEPAVPPVVLLGEPIGLANPANVLTGVAATTGTSSTTVPSSVPSPTLAGNDDPLGAVTAR